MNIIKKKCILYYERITKLQPLACYFKEINGIVDAYPSLILNHFGRKINNYILVFVKSIINILFFGIKYSRNIVYQLSK